MPLGFDASPLADQTELYRAVMASPVPFCISDPKLPDNPLVWVNPAFERETGYDSASVLGRNCRFLQGPSTDRDAVGRIRDGLAAGEIVRETLLNYRADGTAFWNQLVISPIFDADGTLSHHVGVQTDVTERITASAARDAALALAESAVGRQRALAELGSQLAAFYGSDPARLLERAAELIAGHFPGWCAIATVVDAAVSEIGTSSPSESGARLLFGQLLTSAVEAVAAGGGDWPRIVPLDAADSARALPGSPPLTVLACPVPSHRGAPGLLVLARPTGASGFDDRAEVEAVCDAAARTGLALDNARLYSAEHHAAVTLQRSLLPRLPVLDGFDIAASYLPASTAEVGGDWFAVNDLPGSRIGVAVGDVSGHDINAAAAMGQLSATVRTLAWEGHRPSELVTRADRLVRDTAHGWLATLFFALVDRPVADGPVIVSYVSAGHPPALLRYPDGTTYRLGSALTSPLGVPDPRVVTDAEVELPVGAMLVLYSDGLVERPDRDLDDQITALVERVAHGPAGSAELMRDQLTAQLHSGELADDVCLLMVRRTR